MAVEAHISPTWRRQKLFISIFFFAVGAWFASDGLYTWPKSNERWTAHEELVKAGRTAEWPAAARSHGWVETPPHKYYERSDLIGQFVVAGLAGAVGALLLIYWLTQKDRSLRLDEEAVYTPAGSRVPFDAIIGIGKKRWETKGLATVRYHAGGRQRQFVVDDYKFDTEPTHQILEEIEQRLLARTGAAA